MCIHIVCVSKNKLRNVYLIFNKISVKLNMSFVSQTHKITAEIMITKNTKICNLQPQHYQEQ